MNKYKFNMTGLLCSLCLFASSLFVTGCNDDNKAEGYIPDYEIVPEYKEADIWTAYDSFNQYLYDTNRKLYYRDSGKPNDVGAIWTQAIYWDMAMNAYKTSKDAKYLQLVKDIYEGNKAHYANYNWDNGTVWFIYDDIMWWVISLARGYEVTQDPEYLTLSESGFKRVWEGSPVVGDPGSYDPVNGGMYWQWKQTNPPERSEDDGKMACINYPTVIAAMTLYNITKKAEYLDKAKEIYQWSYDNLFDSKRGLVADSKHGKNNPDWTTTVYNQATCIGAAVMLYKETGEQRYLDDAIIAADYTRDEMSAPLIILPYRNGEEQGIYTAIFAQYIVRLIEDCNKPEYLPWLRRTINYGWKNRDAVRNLTYKNYTVPTSTTDNISCYDASGIPALMLVIPAESK